MKFGSLADFAAHMLTLQRDMNLAAEATVVKGAQLIQKRAKAAIGDPNNGFGWPPLKEATIAQKRLGNTPLYETGDLKRSIEVSGPFHEGAGTVSAYVGTNDKKAAIHEFGGGHVPPRPFLGPATAMSEADIVKIAQRQVARAMAGGKHYHELKEILHAAHKVHEAVKDLAESIGEDDDK